MRFIPIDQVPRTPKKKLQFLITDFVNRHEAIVEITYAPGEYCNPHSCYSSFFNAARLSGYKLRVTCRSDRVFMENLAITQK